MTFRYIGIDDDENKEAINNFSILMGYLERLKGVFKKMKERGKENIYNSRIRTEKCQRDGFSDNKIEEVGFRIHSFTQ